jgi:hypothetical protein
MRDQTCTVRIPATDFLAFLTRLYFEWPESAHPQEADIRAPDVGGFGALVTAIVVLCTCVLSAVLSAVFMLVS